MSKPISQREARRLRARVRDLEWKEERRRFSWAADYPGGTFMAQVQYDYDNLLPITVKACRKLRHAVVVTEDAGLLRFYALPVGSTR